MGKKQDAAFDAAMDAATETVSRKIVDEYLRTELHRKLSEALDKSINGFWQAKSETLLEELTRMCALDAVELIAADLPQLLASVHSRERLFNACVLSTHVLRPGARTAVSPLVLQIKSKVAATISEVLAGFLADNMLRGNQPKLLS